MDPRGDDSLESGVLQIGAPELAEELADRAVWSYADRADRSSLGVFDAVAVSGGNDHDIARVVAAARSFIYTSEHTAEAVIDALKREGRVWSMTESAGAPSRRAASMIASAFGAS